MKTDLGLKLIAVVNAHNFSLYEAQGIKVINGPQKITLSEQHHQKPEKRDSLYQKKSDPASHFEPHTSPAVIDHRNTAREVADHLDQISKSNKFKEVIIVAEPKMLGYLREYISAKLKKYIVKEINKDMIQHNPSIIEDVVFA